MNLANAHGESGKDEPTSVSAEVDDGRRKAEVTVVANAPGETETEEPYDNDTPSKVDDGNAATANACGESSDEPTDESK